jgi:hypothetical protein
VRCEPKDSTLSLCSVLSLLQFVSFRLCSLCLLDVPRRVHDVLGGEVEVGEDAGERVHQLGDGKQVGSGHDGVHGQELIASVRPDERSVKWRVKSSQLTAESSKTVRTGRGEKINLLLAPRFVLFLLYQFEFWF